MPVEIDIVKNAGDWPDEDAIEALARTCVSEVFSTLNFANVDSELSLVLTDDAEIRAINTQWRSIDKPTNVLSFPAFNVVVGQAPKAMLGDVILAYETILREADLEKISFNDHLSHLIIHGLLHLLGYDHENDKDAEEMESLETAILAKLEIADPYADHTPDI